MLKLAACEVDLERGRVQRGGAWLALTTREADLLRYLVAHRDRVVPREELLREVWGYDDAVVSRASDNVVRRLREKIETSPAEPEHLLTVFGTGYRLVLGEETTVVARTPHRSVPLGDAVVDLTARRVRRGDEEALLSEPEALVLEALVAAAGEPVDRWQLERAAWGRGGGPTRRLDGVVAGLRGKIEADPHAPAHVLTVRGRGYRLDRGGVSPAVAAQPPASAGARLPTERDPFVGRGVELARLGDALHEGRLVTLYGPGGVGKTRLAVRHAWADLGAWPGGAWFCDLSEARSADEIGLAVAGTFDVSLGASPIDQLGHALGARGRCLVVLDNFEQLVAFAEPVVGRWLALAPEARFVVTSRVVLGVPGEVAVVVGPLAPDEAVVLFDRRARWARREYTPTDAERPTVEALVARLDHLPLAVELAASRVRSMSPAEILARLERRFQLLVGAASGRPARHTTLRATLDWSWDLLPAADRIALARLSTLEGPFSLDVAEELLGEDDGWPADAVQSLVEWSLVQRGAGAGGALSLTWSVRDYARERLADLGLAEAAELQHGRLFARRCDGDVRAVLSDVVAACRRAVARRDVEVAVVTALAANEVFGATGPYALGEALVRSVLGLEPTGAGRAELERALGLVLFDQGDTHAAVAQLERALAAAGDDVQLVTAARTALGRALARLGRFDEAEVQYQSALGHHGADDADTLAHLGALRNHQGDSGAAAELLRRAVDGHRARGDTGGLAFALAQLGAALLDLGELREAWSVFTEARASFREVGRAAGEAMTLLNLGALACRADRVAEGVAAFEEAAALARRIGNRPLLASALSNLGLAADLEPRARDWLSEGLALAREVGAVENEAIVLLQLGRYHMRHGDPAAADLYRAAVDHTQRHGLRYLEGYALLGLSWMLAAGGAIGEAADRLALGRERLAGHPHCAADVDQVTGAWLARQGRWDEARVHYRASIHDLRVRDRLSQAGEVLEEWEQLERAAGHAVEADALRAERG